MKNILIFSLLTNFAIPLAWGDCDNIDEYSDIIKTLIEELDLLKQESGNILTEDHPLSDMYTHKILTEETYISGSELLRQEEEWQEIVENIEDEKKKTLLQSILPSIGLVGVSGINYYLYKHPPESKSIFSEQLLRPINGKILSRTMAGLFLAYLAGQTGWLVYKYFSLSGPMAEAQVKMNVLKKLADTGDRIKSKERMLTHYEIQSKLLRQTCLP